MDIIQESILEARKSDFIGMISKMNKFMTRKSLPLVVYSFGEVFYKSELFIDRDWETGQIAEVPVETAYVPVTVSIELPEHIIKGFKYAGSISDKQGTVAVFSADETVSLSNTYSMDLNFKCSHCGVTRPRNFKAIFTNEITNEPFYIGSSCAKEYFGMDFLKAVEELLYKMKTFQSEGHEVSERQGRTFCDTLQTIRAALYVFATEKKFVSGKKAEEYQTAASSAIVSNVAFGRSNHPDDVAERKAFRNWTYSNETAINADIQKIKSHYAEMIPNSDFDFNIKAAMTSDVGNRIGLITYGVWAIVKDHYQQDNVEKITIVNEMIGNEGDIMTATAKFTGFSYADTFYGMMTVVRFVTESGHRLTWFTTAVGIDEVDGVSEFTLNKKVIKMNEMNKFTFKVKSRNEYKDMVSTVVKNVKVVK